MKRIALCIALLLCWIPVLGQTSPGIEGNWLGSLEFGGVKFRFLLKVDKIAGGYSAKFDSIDQGAKDLPIDSISVSGNEMKFSASRFGISYEGTVDDKNDAITGTFRQGAGSTPFVFKRSGAITMTSRPQDPKKPYPYAEEEVSYRNPIDNVKLTGTLTFPKESKRHPAVILISGSGSQDRDSLTAGHRPFLVLADHLTRKGIAVLRVDDRGTGGSDMGNMSVTSENFMHDVLAGVNFLKGRAEIDPKQIGLIGHSEGAMIAPMAAVRSTDIAFIVMLAGPGQRGEDVIYTQTELIGRANGTSAETITHSVAIARMANAVVKTETDPVLIESRINKGLEAYSATLSEEQRKAFAPVEASARSFMPMYKLPWYRYFIMFDPTPILKKTRVPVLALNGGLDLQIASTENLGLIAAALKVGSNKDFTVRSFPALNHLFQTCKTGLPSEYATIDETISPLVLSTVSDWIVARTGLRKGSSK